MTRLSVKVFEAVWHSVELQTRLVLYRGHCCATEEDGYGSAVFELTFPLFTLSSDLTVWQSDCLSLFSLLKRCGVDILHVKHESPRSHGNGTLCARCAVEVESYCTSRVDHRRRVEYFGSSWLPNMGDDRSRAILVGFPAKILAPATKHANNALLGFTVHRVGPLFYNPSSRLFSNIYQQRRGPKSKSK